MPKKGRVEYEGRVKIIEFDPENMGDAELAVQDFVKLKPDEKLYVSQNKSKLTIKALKKRVVE